MTKKAKAKTLNLKLPDGSLVENVTSAAITRIIKGQLARKNTQFKVIDKNGVETELDLYFNVHRVTHNASEIISKSEDYRPAFLGPNFIRLFDIHLGHNELHPHYVSKLEKHSLVKKLPIQNLKYKFLYSLTDKGSKLLEFKKVTSLPINYAETLLKDMINRQFNTTTVSIAKHYDLLTKVEPFEPTELGAKLLKRACAEILINYDTYNFSNYRTFIKHVVAIMNKADYSLVLSKIKNPQYTTYIMECIKEIDNQVNKITIGWRESPRL